MSRRSRTPNRLTVKADSDGLVEAVQAFMDEMAWEVTDDVTEAVSEAGSEASSRLRQESRRRSGAYAKGWRADVDARETGVTATVHNVRKPGLTHLLENGHAIAGGEGRVEGDKLMASVYEQVAKEFEGRLRK